MVYNSSRAFLRLNILLILAFCGALFAPTRNIRSFSSRRDNYLRLVEKTDGYWELQSATAVLRDDIDGRELTLIATVHVGEAAYYTGIQVGKLRRLSSNYSRFF